jgi:hypothetical protein
MGSAWYGVDAHDKPILFRIGHETDAAKLAPRGWGKCIADGVRRERRHEGVPRLCRSTLAKSLFTTRVAEYQNDVADLLGIGFTLIAYRPLRLGLIWPVSRLEQT